MKLLNGNEINWQAYQLGFSACQENKSGNPFIKGSDQWYSWNRGWNSNYNGTLKINNMIKTTITPEQAAKMFGVSIERIKDQYLANAQGLEKMYNKAIATGKKVNGYTAEQLEAMTADFYQRAI